MDSLDDKTNQNENLIFINNQNPSNFENPYMIVLENDSFVIYKNKCCFLILILIIIFIPPSFPFLIIPLLLLENKIEITKSENNDEIIIISKKFGCCEKRYHFPINNTAFEVRADGYVMYCDKPTKTVKIIIYNKGLKEIDLDNSNIRNVPLKTIVIFRGYVDCPELESKLSDFINEAFKNKIFEELNKYVPKFENNNTNMPIAKYKINQKCFDQIIKLSDYYYVYYTYNYFLDSNDSEIFQRIDWIFSKNFDSIFIGVVKEDNYLKSEMYKINEIDKFVITINKNKYTFKVCLKDGRNEDICEFLKQDKQVLDSFIYLINGQINNLTKIEKI
jgi:hypothetical protein